jgi:CheY-like chemotaxis protein
MGDMDERKASALRGARLLVVEDEYTIATDLARALEEAGVHVVGPAGSVPQALRLIAESQDINGAVLDIRLRDERVYPVADLLRQRGIPFVFATGYEGWVIPPAYADVPRCEKPVDTSELARVLSIHS